MKKDLRDVVNQVSERVQSAGKAATDTLNDKEKREQVKGKARETAHEVADVVADLVEGLQDGTKAVIQSEEVAGAIDGFGTMLKGWAGKLREARDQSAATASDAATESDDATMDETTPAEE